MNPGAGHTAGWRFLGRVTPLGEAAGDLVAEMRFEMDNVADLAARDQPNEFVQGRAEPFVGANSKHHSSLAAGCDHALGLGPAQGQRLLAKYRLSRRRNGLDLLIM